MMTKMSINTDDMKVEIIIADYLDKRNKYYGK